MLPPRHRLRNSDDFRSVTRTGRRVGGRYVVLHVLTESTRDSRVGFVVSKAVGNAVTRNRVKRRLRHAAHDLLPNIEPPADIIVRALPRSASADYDQLHREISKGLHRSGVIQ